MKTGLIFVLLIGSMILSACGGQATPSQAEIAVASQPAHQQAAEADECDGIGWNKVEGGIQYWCNNTGASSGLVVYYPEYEGVWLIYSSPNGTNEWKVVR